MWNASRRELLRSSAQVMAGALALRGAGTGKGRIGLVASSHSKLAKPSSIEDPLDYPRVRDMVWKAIEYGRPRAGSLEAKIKPGCWVVIKPNIGSLPPRQGYRAGDVTDLRVTRAVLEYVAEKSRAARITVAEGGSYRRIGDPAPSDVMRQNGVQVDALTCDWGDDFSGLKGTLGGILKDAGERFTGRKFDYVDLSYDPLRDEAGEFKWMDVPRSAGGVGAFGTKKVYVPARTIVNCDFLITVPVLKVHNMCGLTSCLKNYVGTAPRIVYGSERAFSNGRLHSEHNLEGRIDSFITDLSAFHPPDFCVVDMIRGLQSTEHSNGRPDQQIRTNSILAGEDPVATDALAASLIGFQPADIEFLHMASQRQMGTLDLRNVKVVGDEPDRLRRKWAKPRNWYGRCNRVWLLTEDPAADLRAWERFTSPVDTLHLAQWRPPNATYQAAVKVVAEGGRKAFLWVGARGRVTAFLNGEKVMEEEGVTRYRVGQFQKPVEVRSGENLLSFEVKALAEQADLSVLLVGPENDGDTVEGIRWTV